MSNLDPIVDQPTDLEDIIADTITDLDTPTDASEPVATDTTPVDAAPVTDTTDTVVTEEPKDPAAQAVAAQPTDPETESDEAFAKRHGLPVPRPGMNNRIPYANVRKTLLKQAREITTKVENQFKTKVTELEERAKAYDSQIQQVQQFEHVMVNDPAQFFNMLATNIPAYREYFQQVQAMAQELETLKKSGGQSATQPVDDDPRPLPKQLSDGSMGYDDAGLDELMAWNRRQAVKEAQLQMKPLQDAEEARQRQAQQQAIYQQNVQAVSSMLTNARQNWPNFTELEKDIETILSKDQRLNLEQAYIQAYQQVIVPRLTADRTKMRAEILDEVTQRGRSAQSSAPARQVRTQPTEPDYSGMDQDERLLAIVRETANSLRK